MKQKNIVLIGMPGTGKSTVGVILAKKLGFDFVDTDILLANAMGKTLPKIIEERGYEGFLRCEGRVGEDIDVERTVIATGGSMVLSARAMERLIDHAVIVWLNTDVSELERRINSNMNDRGVVTDKPMTVREIYEMRKPYYEKYTQILVDCVGDIESVVNDIKKRLEEMGFVNAWN